MVFERSLRLLVRNMAYSRHAQSNHPGTMLMVHDTYVIDYSGPAQHK